MQKLLHHTGATQTISFIGTFEKMSPLLLSVVIAKSENILLNFDKGGWNPIWKVKNLSNDENNKKN